MPSPAETQNKAETDPAPPALAVQLTLATLDYNQVMHTLLAPVPDELSPRSAPPLEPRKTLQELLNHALPALDQEIIAKHKERTLGPILGKAPVPLYFQNAPAGYRPGNPPERTAPARKLAAKDQERYRQEMEPLLEKRRLLALRIENLLPSALADQGGRIWQEYRIHGYPSPAAVPASE